VTKPDGTKEIVGTVPDAKSLIRLSGVAGAAGIEAIHLN
jgi:hypothetical protein